MMRFPRPARLARLALPLVLALATAGVSSAADVLADVDDIHRQTAQLRGLERLADVPLEVIDVETLRDRLAAGAQSERGIRQAAIAQKLLVVLGLVAPELDLPGSVRDVLSAEGAGFYDPSERKMWLISVEPTLSPRGKLAVAHELTHALQDQHFDLDALLARDGPNADRAGAVRALVEGDAVLTMVLWGRQFLTPEEKAALGSPGRERPDSPYERAPLVVREELLFPYREGYEFVQTLYRRGGFAAVNEAFLAPPESTEQVIHPEKYLAGEPPVVVLPPSLAPALGEGWQTLRSDVLGELDLRILIEQFSERSVAEAAVAGWGGDSFTMLEDEEGRLLVVLETVWDTEADAAEFYNAYAPTVAARFGSGQWRLLDQPSLVRWSTPTGLIQLLKTGDRVRLTFAPDEETLEVVAAQSGPAQPVQP